MRMRRMMFAAALLAGIVVQAAAQPRDEPTARDVLDKIFGSSR
jgi:hypothetical protein